jgi:hypothetical protein
MTATIAEPAQAITLEAFHPAALIIEGNYRSKAEDTLTPEWVSQLTEHFKRSTQRFPVHGQPGVPPSPCGNHTAVAIVTRPDGALRVLIGSRRVLGNLRAGIPVLGYIAGPEGDTDAARRAELIDQFTENHGRVATTTADDAALVAALFEIKGTTEASLATYALAAPIARGIALTALTALGLSSDPVHEPVHARGLAPPHPATVRKRCGDIDPPLLRGARTMRQFRRLPWPRAVHAAQPVPEAPLLASRSARPGGHPGPAGPRAWRAEWRHLSAGHARQE